MLIKANNEISRRVLQAAADGDLEYIKNAPSHVVKKALCSSGCTALHWAAGSGHIEVLDYLITDSSLQVSPNITATKLAKGRTPLHYSCRNGFLDASKRLVELGADVDIKAKNGVTPFQLAVWQNHLPICAWLVEDQGVDAAQVNDFQCGAVHWLGIVPEKLVTQDKQESLIYFAKWLAKQKGVNFHAKQRMGHTPFHKAAWGGHLGLVKYLHEHHSHWDNVQDQAGNYAADLADMANTPRHTKVAKYLREECSAEREKSCQILGVNLNADKNQIRKAYLEKARLIHPNRMQLNNNAQNRFNDENQTISYQCEKNAHHSNIEYDFDTLKKAYDHLTLENGIGKQSNPSHSINLMLAMNAHNSDSKTSGEDSYQKGNGNLTELDLFKARLIAVLLEYGEDGIPLCNIKKQWKRVWPNDEFPDVEKCDGVSQKKKGSLANFIKANAGDVVEMSYSNRKSGFCIVYPKYCKREDIVTTSITSQT